MTNPATGPSDTGQRCFECDYNLTAFDGDRCPECGWRISWPLTDPAITERRHTPRDVIRLTVAIVLASGIAVFALIRLNVWTPALSIGACLIWASFLTLGGHLIVLNELFHPSRPTRVAKTKLAIAITAALLQLTTAIAFIAVSITAALPFNVYPLALLPGATLLVIAFAIIPNTRKHRRRKFGDVQNSEEVNRSEQADMREGDTP